MLPQTSLFEEITTYSLDNNKKMAYALNTSNYLLYGMIGAFNSIGGMVLNHCPLFLSGMLSCAVSIDYYEKQLKLRHEIQHKPALWLAKEIHTERKNILGIDNLPIVLKQSDIKDVSQALTQLWSYKK